MILVPPAPQPTFSKPYRCNWFCKWFLAPRPHNRPSKTIQMHWFYNDFWCPKTPNQLPKSIQMLWFSNDFWCPALQPTFQNHADALILQWFLMPRSPTNFPKPYKCRDFEMILVPRTPLPPTNVPKPNTCTDVAMISGAPLPQPTFQNHTNVMILQWFLMPHHPNQPSKTI